MAMFFLVAGIVMFVVAICISILSVEHNIIGWIVTGFFCIIISLTVFIKNGDIEMLENQIVEQQIEIDKLEKVIQYQIIRGTEYNTKHVSSNLVEVTE
jgi:hypothetical protein